MSTATENHSMELSAAVELTAKAGKPAKVSILAYSGGLMTVPNWGPVAINLNKLGIMAGFPILVDHDASLNGVLGSGTAEVRNGKLFASGTISRTADAAKRVIELAKDGVAFQASVGLAPTLTQHVRAGEKVMVNGQSITSPASGMTLVQESTLKEISITILGADNSTSVSIEASSKGKTMSKDTNTNESSTDLKARMFAEAADNMQRISAIQDAASEYPAIAAMALREDWSIEKVELEVLKASRPKAPSATVKAAGRDLGSQHIEANLLIRAGYSNVALKSYGEQVTNQASEMGRLSLVELAAMCCQMEGQTPSRNKQEMLRAAASTMSLPNALANTMGRVLETVYMESPSSWRSFCAIRSADDFKDQTSIRPSFLEQSEKVGTDGKLKHSEISESTISWSLDTYGKMFSVSRRDMINDNLGFLDELAPGMARASLRALNDLVWRTILDDSTHFTAGRNNLLTGGSSVLSETSLTTAVKQMRLQRDTNGNDLDIQPMTLVVPPALEVTARRILESAQIQAAEGQGMGNPLSSIANLEVESRIENTDKFAGAGSTQWYLFAGIQDLPALVGFLNGQQSPTVEFFGLDHQADSLAMTWRTYHDFGFALGDFHAGQKSAGA